MVRFSSAAGYVRTQLAATPLATLITGYDAARRNHLIDALAQDAGADLAPYARGDEGLTFPQEVHVVLARSQPQLTGGHADGGAAGIPQ
jgi:hypothetical protein